MVDCSFAKKVGHRNLHEDFWLFSLKVFMLEKVPQRAIEHIIGKKRDWAKTSTFYEEWLVMKFVGRLNNIAIGIKKDSLSEALCDEFQTHDPVVEHLKIRAGEPNHIDFYTLWSEIIEERSNKSLGIFSQKKSTIDKIDADGTQNFLLIEVFSVE